MSQLPIEHFNKGFFTMAGAVSAIVLVYPFYHSCHLLCKKYFRNESNKN